MVSVCFTGEIDMTTLASSSHSTPVFSNSDRKSEGGGSAASGNSSKTSLRIDDPAEGDKLRTHRRPARRPDWMDLPELADANNQAARASTNYAAMTAEQLRRAATRRVRNEIDFISHPHFAKPGCGEEVFGDALELSPSRGEPVWSKLHKTNADLPAHLRRLCEAPLLTPKQERGLFQRMNFLLQQASIHRSLLDPHRPSRRRLELIEQLLGFAKWHRDRIVEANLRLVFSIVKKFVNQGNSFDELLSDGIVALIRAVEKFDFDRGFRFSTYATQVVRRGAYRTVVEQQEDRQRFVGGLQAGDVDLEDDARTSAISEKRWHELRGRLATMLNELDRREKLIIRARFSLGSHRKVHTLQAIADRLGVSKERVRQLERRAMDKLRTMAGGVTLADLES